MLYATGLNNNVLQAYDLEVEPDADPDEEDGGTTKWPMYRYTTEALIRELSLSPDRRWLFALNELGRVEIFQSKASGRLTRMPSIDLPDGRATSVGIHPDATQIYITSDEGLVYRYTIESDGESMQSGEPVAGPTSQVRAILGEGGTTLYLLDSEESKIWQYSIGSSGELSPLTPSTVTVVGGPGEAIWNSAQARLYVSCIQSNQLAVFSTSGSGQLQEVTRVSAPARPGQPGISADGQYLFVASREGTSEIFRYQIGGGTTPLTPSFPTGHVNQTSAVVNPFGHFFVVNAGDRNYSEYRIYPDGVLTLRRTKGLDFNAGLAVFRVNP